MVTLLLTAAYGFSLLSSVRPLYDVPYMFEAREFLRKKLIGKKVNVTLDYIQVCWNFRIRGPCYELISP